MPAVRSLRRLLALPVPEVVDLVRAQLLLLGAQRALHRAPRGALLHPVAFRTTPGAPVDLRRIERMALAVDRVARRGLFRPTCLVRAMALEQVAQAIAPGVATVRIGVHRGDDQFFAHAWLECEGRVIGDDPRRVQRFVPLHAFSAFPS